MEVVNFQAKGVDEKEATKRNQSKYDFIKVRVWLEDHFYVISRYLICRALVCSKIKPKDAVKISLELKKTLVDLGFVDIVQEQFEDYLYKTMAVYGYGKMEINRYGMMTEFFQKRVPVLILIAGTAYIGKSTFANKVAERLNLSSVLQTDIVSGLIKKFSTDTDPGSSSFTNQVGSVEQYGIECEQVRSGVEGDINKCLKEGKPLLLEGFHLDPTLYGSLLAEMRGQTESDNSSGALEAKQSQRYGIIVPFLLTLDREEHETLMKRSPDPRFGGALLDYYQQIQELLKGKVQATDSASQFEVVKINLHSFDETVDHLHDIVLQRIEREHRDGRW